MYTNENSFLRLNQGYETRALQNVNSAFQKFYDGITLTGDQRDLCNRRKDHIVELLEKDLEIIDAFATGSIPKFTALRSPHCDADVMVVLHYGKHIEGRKPSQVLQSVRDCLAESKTNVRKNGQAVTLHYKTWPNVDIVPVSRTPNSDGSISHYNVPDMNTETWIISRPRKHAIAIADRVSSFGPEFRRIIKMIKWWNLQHSSYLQSYHIEVLALNILESSFSDYPWNVYQFFKEAHTLTQNYLWYEDGYADNYLGYSDRQEALKRLATARDKASDAWYASYSLSDHNKAMRLWKQVFGEEFPTND